MTSKITIDVAKIKEERKQYASKLEIYKTVKSKQKKVNSLIKFDELKKFHALEQIVSEPSIPVDEYRDPPGICILNPEQYQNICNASGAYKKAIHRKGQANIKISNILNYSDYSKEEKQEIGLNLLFLMSIHPSHTYDCFHILDRWAFEWQPTFQQLCVLFENLGCNVRKHLGKNHHVPQCYDVAIIKSKVDYEEFNVKTFGSKLSELNVDCLKNVLIYMKAIIGHFNQDEVQSLLVILSALSLDTHCMQFKENFNELVNNCFALLENTNMDNLLNTLYLNIENSMYQCYFVNKILNPCNTVCKPFTIQLSYLYMCNLLFNYELVGLGSSLNDQSNISIDSSLETFQKDLRSKRKLIESTDQALQFFPCAKKVQKIASPKKQLQIVPSPKNLFEKEKLLLEKENKKLNFAQSTLKQTSRKGRGKNKLNKSTPDKKQKSILDYWKYKEKSPDLSKPSSSIPPVSPKKPVAVTEEKQEEDKVKDSAKDLLEINDFDQQGNPKNIGDIKVDPQETSVQNPNDDLDLKINLQEPISINLTDETSQDSSDDETLPSNTLCEQRELIFTKYKANEISFAKLYRRVRMALQRHLDSPIRIYRTVNLLNCIVKLLGIDESNMATCKLLMQVLSHVQYKYYGLHDMHRHLVCVYLQQYTTVWGTDINRIHFRIEQRNQDYKGSDSE